MTDDGLVLLGRVVGTHGIKGQLRVVSYSGSFDTLLAARTVLLRPVGGKPVEHVLTAAAVHGKKLLLSLEGYRDINQVQILVGCDLLVRREQLPPAEEDEFYWHDLIGLQVVTVEGTRLGRLASIIETGSNDVFVVKSGGREYLIPALAEVVTAVDLTARTMTVNPIDGLLDL
jgi:16S rRNA processing protein RimM